MIILHIGMEKTGTKTIQNFLIKNKEYLCKNGIVVPEFESMGLVASIVKKALKIEIYENSEWVCCFDVDAFFKNLQQYNNKNIIISSEHMQSVIRYLSYGEYYIFLEQLAKLINLSGHSVKILIYIRKPDNYIMSSVAERVKHDGKLDFQVRVKNRKDVDNASLMKLWANVFGKKAIVIRSFESCMFQNRDVISDFITIAMPVIRLESCIQVERENEKLPIQILYLFWLMHNDFESPEEFRKFFWPLLSELRQLPFKRMAIYSLDQRESINEYYLPKLQKLQKFFDLPELFPPQSIDKSGEVFPGYLQKEETDILLEFFSEQRFGTRQAERVRERITNAKILDLQKVISLKTDLIQEFQRVYYFAIYKLKWKRRYS